MKYADGSDIQAGDLVRIDSKYQGRVLASMDTSQYLPDQEHWAYLGRGIVVDTDFGGCVHYTDEATDCLELLSRLAR
jgi:hypothetical protein